MTRKFTGTELVIATHNKGKMAEMTALFAPFGIKLYSAADLGLESPPETGTTFAENSEMKARYVAEKTGKPALSDDSGMCVNALDGAPGVYTADWAEENGPRDFNYAMEKVIRLMGDNPDRSARFVSVLTLCWPDGHIEMAEGVAEGTLVWPMRGTKGHGMDPIFVPQGDSRTYAEMEQEEKNGISHRARSFRAMIDKCFR